MSEAPLTVLIEPNSRPNCSSQPRITVYERPSPIRSLLASVTNKYSSSHSRKRKLSTRTLKESASINTEPATTVDTDEIVWGGVVLHSFVTDTVKSSTAVTITPDWKPPSPTPVPISTRNPRVLLQSPLIARFSYLGESSGDCDSDSSDDTDLPFTQVVSPLASYAPDYIPATCYENRSICFTPASPLATCNIKEYFLASKLSTLPSSTQYHLAQCLPECDKEILMSSSSTKLLELVVNNEYISAALREWQDRLAMGMLNIKRKQRLSYIPKWKEKFYERYWGEKQGSTLHTTHPYFPSSDNGHFTTRQRLVHAAVYKSPSLKKENKLDNCHKILNNHFNLCIPHVQKTSLPVQLPLHAYTIHCNVQQIMMEHSYGGKCKYPSLQVTITTKCTCSGAPLQVCLACNSLFHSVCSEMPKKCPSCCSS